MSVYAKNPKIVISGYYGFDNCGDEAVLMSIVHCLKKLRPDARITVLSGNPEKTRELYDVDAVSRWNPASIARQLATCRLLISGGGSLLQDVTSARSPGYYLGVIRVALLLRKKVMIYSQGIGPLTLEKNRIKAAGILNRCHMITLRDKGSAELLRELGVKRDIVVTSDPVMALGRECIPQNECDSYAVTSDPAIALGRECIPQNECDTYAVTSDPAIAPGREAAAKPRSKPLLVAAIRSWKDDRHIGPFAGFLDAQIAKGWDVLLVPAHYPEDAVANVRLSERMASKPRVIDKALTAQDFLALIASADSVLSMRLHGLICAMAMGTPMLGLSYDPKVDAFMEQAGLEDYCLPFDSLGPESTKRMIDILGALPPQPSAEQESRRKEMQQTAWETARLAVSLL